MSRKLTQVSDILKSKPQSVFYEKCLQKFFLLELRLEVQFYLSCNFCSPIRDIADSLHNTSFPNNLILAIKNIQNSLLFPFTKSPFTVYEKNWNPLSAVKKSIVYYDRKCCLMCTTKIIYNKKNQLLQLQW